MGTEAFPYVAMPNLQYLVPILWASSGQKSATKRMVHIVEGLGSFKKKRES
jgi:hypothetical protein